MRRALIFIGLVIFSGTGLSQQVTEKDYKSQFDRYGVEGCFVLFDQAGNQYIRYNPALCDSGYLPASTFKIPNTLIVLEEKIINDTSQVIKWDGQKWPVQSWNRDQTLRTAMKYSCVWVYIGFAEQVGIEKYYRYVEAFDYGNQNLAGPPNRFWLQGELRISANQQIDFLRKFYNNQLPVSCQSVDIVKSLIILEQTDAYRLSGKTGGTRVNDREFIMWLVGYVENGGRVYYYALNFRADDFDRTAAARYEITKNILRDLKLIG